MVTAAMLLLKSVRNILHTFVDKSSAFNIKSSIKININTLTKTVILNFLNY